MRVAAVLTAAGSGSRLGHALPKALVPVAGAPLVVHAARRLARSGVVDEIVVTAPRAHLAAFASAMTHAGDGLAGVTVRLAVGGATRQASVAAGLAELGPDVGVVLVHDAARAFAPADLVRRVVDAVRAGHRAVVPGVPLTDTVVEVGPPVRTVDRSVLRAVQTPQGFDRTLLDAAHAAASTLADDETTAATDDATLCARLGETVTLVDGSDAALKVTTPRDLAVAVTLADTPDGTGSTEVVA